MNEKDTSELVYISVDDIEPHPKNPRKDVGDVSELAESLKANGIMQNLTVVPNVGSGKPYRALIGHRRLAAAKLAGLGKVPCKIVTGLDEKTQVGIMLAENMQRSDLTVIEEADGIQMMLDLGDTVSQVCEKTGISETTAYRRLKLLKFDREGLKKSLERGATLADYDEIAAISDEKQRDELLNSVGTRNFAWDLQYAKNKNEREKRRSQVIEKIKEFAEFVTTDNLPDNLICRCRIWFYNSSDPDKAPVFPDDINKTKYYAVDEEGSVILYSEKTDEEKAADEKKTAKAETRRLENIARQERVHKLEEISADMANLQFNFVKKFRDFKCLKSVDRLIAVYHIWEEFQRYLLRERSDIDYTTLAKLMNIDTKSSEYKADSYKVISEALEKEPPQLQMIYTIFAAIAKTYDLMPFNSWTGTYSHSENLDTLYNILGILGYEKSEVETAMSDGTHELYLKEG